MEKPHHLPSKSSSFTAREEKKPREPVRNLSLNRHPSPRLDLDLLRPPPSIAEEDDDDANITKSQPAPEPQRTLPQLAEEIDAFLSAPDGDRIPDSTIDKYALLVEKEIAHLECPPERPSPLSCHDQPEFSLLDAIHRLSKLDTALGSLPDSKTHCVHALNHTGVVLNHAMSFLEDEFRAVLDETATCNNNNSGSCKWTPPSASIPEEEVKAEQPEGSNGDSSDANEKSNDEKKPPAPYPPERVEWLRRVAEALCSAGYDTECYQAFVVARRNALDATLAETGFEKVGVEEVQKMPWETLEREIVKWLTAFRLFFSACFPHERDLCEAVFAGNPTMVPSLYGSITWGPIFQLMTFVEAVTMTKRSSEKLFKFLDIYEALRDLVPTIDDLFPWAKQSGEAEGAENVMAQQNPWEEYKTELLAAKARLGEAAVGIFTDLEGSIKADSGKTPVPGGAVHPLTRYVMNYVKYAGEYKKTLVQVFQEHHKTECSSSPPRPGDDTSDRDHGSSDNQGNANENGDDDGRNSSFATQLTTIMGMLDGNLETKAKLYKDPSLSSIFLMNNGRYMVQKVKGSPEIYELLGNTWYRKRSSDLRQYHKSYQRETWGKVLSCFRDEGLTTKGGVSKPVLKERFKSFNAQLEEIHKTQSTWVVSDEQLQSELRVSVQAVIVPAYRSFLGRFQQYLDAGRQTEKYIKFAPEDLENYIDELFDGNPASMIRRRT